MALTRTGCRGRTVVPTGMSRHCGWRGQRDAGDNDRNIDQHTQERVGGALQGEKNMPRLHPDVEDRDSGPWRQRPGRSWRRPPPRGCDRGRSTRMPYEPTPSLVDQAGDDASDQERGDERSSHTPSRAALCLCACSSQPARGIRCGPRWSESGPRPRARPTAAAGSCAARTGCAKYR